MPDRTIQLKHLWTLGDRVGGGGFGSVFIASSPEVEAPAVAKLVPKAPGAKRELLFVDLADARNVVPVIDSGEDGDDYVLVMERAEKSLKQHLDEQGKLSERETVAVLRDIVAALEDLTGRVIHRDLKPANVLLLNESWCLADFGISRYAEATTSENTRKYSMTHAYAAPEQWRLEQATAATDIYALGIMVYEMLAGTRPFLGPDFRNQHLHEVPALLEGVSTPMAALVSECLQKHPGSRPSAGDLARRLSSIGGPPARQGLAGLQELHHEEVNRRAEAQSQAARDETANERSQRLYEDGVRSLQLIGDELRGALVETAPSIISGAGRGDLWTLELGKTTFRLSAAHQQTGTLPGVPFEVVAYAALTLDAPGVNGYRGRSHSLWYCDAEEEGRFGWYELAFMQNALLGGMSTTIPYALRPDEAAPAIAPGVATVQLAWNLRRLVPGELDEFIVRWGNWFVRACKGPWQHPHQVPEEQMLRNWRGA